MVSPRHQPQTSVATLSDDERELPTDRRLLLAAERLFAATGMHAVSLRSINAAAATNVAALHYHFGSKEALVNAVIRQRSREIHQRRSALLAALEATETITARTLAEAFALPVAEMGRSGARAWIRLVANIIDEGGPTLDVVTEGFFDHGTRFRALTEKLHPDWHAAAVVFRLSQAMALTFRVLGNIDGVRATVTAGGIQLDDEEVIAELVDLLTALLR